MTPDEKRLLAKAAAYCSRSEHCLFDVEEKLRQWGAASSSIASITSCLIDEQFVDHRRYALFFVRDKFRFNGWGRLKIAQALWQKRIEREVVREALAQIDDSDYFEKLKELIASKKKTIGQMEEYELQSKLFRFAASRGFEPELVRQAIGASDELF